MYIANENKKENFYKIVILFKALFKLNLKKVLLNETNYFNYVLKYFAYILIVKH